MWCAAKSWLRSSRRWGEARLLSAVLLSLACARVHARPAAARDTAFCTPAAPASSPPRLPFPLPRLLRSADEVVVSGEGEGLAERVQEITGGAGAWAAIECIGGEIFGKASAGLWWCCCRRCSLLLLMAAAVARCGLLFAANHYKLMPPPHPPALPPLPRAPPHRWCRRCARGAPPLSMAP